MNSSGSGERKERRLTERDVQAGFTKDVNSSDSGERKERRLTERDVQTGFTKDVRGTMELGVPNEKHFAIT
ncbi:hypothetical protein PoB_003952100 [Plakobranchus ocellatus]|uniref:Uncharacterized protein n=1 Tax=Plakobranchus ocellatus TaxID=259542 RepID=A0AAV4APB6_9GAST|nr:hypothetical protein PoB_003952100 [Plakobranchus ocellatus]